MKTLRRALRASAVFAPLRWKGYRAIGVNSAGISVPSNTAAVVL
jgi:hypothetical protein